MDIFDGITATDAIDNDANIINTQDIIARIGELDELAEEYTLSADLAKELVDLKAFAAEVEPHCEDWNYGRSLVRFSYFTEYVKEETQEIHQQHVNCHVCKTDTGGPIDWSSFPYKFIDWDLLAEEAESDYNEGNFDGVKYLFY